VTSGSPKHSRSTPCPTMPVAPNRMTFIRFPVASWRMLQAAAAT
jgi:hypothetical protein